MGVVIFLVWAAMVAAVGYRMSLTWRALRLERAGDAEQARVLRERAFHLRMWLLMAVLVALAVVVIAAVVS
jgi:hypothetical protein